MDMSIQLLYLYSMSRMIKSISLFFVLSCVVFTMQAQDSWHLLAQVEITKSYDPEFGIETMIPTISKSTHELNGQTVVLKGFIIPLTGEVEQSHFMFSKFPQNMCFFCGKAGPESAIQVFMKGGKKLPFTSEKIILQGRLIIQNDTSSGLLYTMEDGEIIN